MYLMYITIVEMSCIREDAHLIDVNQNTYDI